MRLHLWKRDQAVVGLTTLVLVALSVIGWIFFGGIALGAVLSLGFGCVMWLQYEFYRRSKAAVEEVARLQRADYRQIEALMSLVPCLNLRAPLPPTRDWAMSPDLLSVLAGLINERRPRRILELGGGVSTLVQAYCLKNAGAGTLLSIDHDPSFASISENALVSHGLENVADVIVAPLVEIEVRGHRGLWYDTETIGDIGIVDMLVVDGPPGYLQKMSRYPAVPVLMKHLSSDAVIVVDDADRDDEKIMVKLWLELFDNLSVEHVETEKGACILKLGTRLSR